MTLGASTQPIQNPQIVQDTVPIQNNSLKSNTSSFPWVLLGVIVAVIVIGILIFLYALFFKHAGSNANYPSSPTAAYGGGAPSAKVTDLAPALSADKKTVLLVQDSDSSFEKIIVPTVQVETFIKSLPEGQRFVSQSPDK